MGPSNPSNAFPGGTKVSVAVVAKALGEKWRGLSDEERLKYKQMAVAAVSEAMNVSRKMRKPLETSKDRGLLVQASAKESKDKENQDEEDKPLKEPRKKARRGPTAYFIFMEEHRASVQKELQDACGTCHTPILFQFSFQTSLTVKGLVRSAVSMFSNAPCIALSR